MIAVTKLDDRREHISIQTANGDTHVIPISVFRHIVAGKLTINKISDFIPVYREITKQWMQFKGLI